MNEIKIGFRRKKVQIFVAICFVHLFFFWESKAQAITIYQTDKTVKEILVAIEKTSDMVFFYNNKDVDLNRKTSVQVDNASIEKVLDLLFANTQNTYKIDGRQVYILKKNESVKELKNVEQQKKTITGKITDKEGESVIGANILEKGTTNGTITDVDGKFSITVENNAIILVSYIGYLPQEINTTGQTSLIITLLEDNLALEELIVVGYGVQKKVNLSGSVSTVPAETLKDRPVVSVGQALQGSVANMNVTIGSGQATDSPSFNIRGTTSINGGTPLVVIDGIVSDKDHLNRMNPTDIESISVLKDAASSAIYGSRAAFGVILVTTKTGKSEKLNINYNNSFVMRQLTKLVDIITDPYDIATTRNIMSYPWYNLYNEEQLAYAKKRSEDPDNTSLYYVNPDGTYSYFGNTNWVDEAYQKFGLSTNHTIDFSGKTEKINYFFSGNYNFQDGMIKYGTDKYNRYNLRSKLDFTLTNWWKISNNTSYITSDYEAPNYLGSSYYWEINRRNPLDVPYNPNGSWTQQGASILGRMQEGGRVNRNQSTLTTQFGTKIDIIKNIFFINGSFAFRMNNNNNNGYSLPVAYYRGEELPPLYLNEITEATVSNTGTKHISFDIYGSFNKTFNNKHTISAITGFNQEEYRYDYTTANRKSLISNSLPTIGLATGDMNMNQSIETWALRGAFGRINYTFDNKYIIEFNGRYDGTSRFPKDKRFAFNPSGSAAWIISQENFFNRFTSIISYLKIRGSYGSLGNQDVGAYAYLATMGSGKISQILDGQQPVYVSAAGLVSGNLTWEKVITSNVGVDINILNNKLTASFDAYVRHTKDMLTGGASLPSVLGTSVPKENAADLETKGWELTLGWRDRLTLDGKPLNYDVSFNIADSRAFITKFANSTGTLSDYYVGQELGEIWGATTLGFFTSEEDIKNHADQSLVTSYPGTRPLAPGDLKFKDMNDDDVIDWGKWTIDDHGDYHIIGNNRSRYTFGFTTNVDWNNFDLGIFIQGVAKKDYMPGTSDLYFWGIYSQPWTNVTYGNFHDRWTEDNPNGYFPRFKSYVAEQTDKEAGVPQTRYLQNAAYARLKNLTFGYSLPKQLTQKINIERLRVFFSGDNIAEISGLYKYYKVDPEGLGGQSYPLQRSYSFGLNVSF